MLTLPVHPRLPSVRAQPVVARARRLAQPVLAQRQAQRQARSAQARRQAQRQVRSAQPVVARARRLAQPVLARRQAQPAQARLQVQLAQGRPAPPQVPLPLIFVMGVIHM